MKTNYSDMAKRYQLAKIIIWDNLEPYKRVLIEQDTKNNVDSRHIKEFTHKIAELAESTTDLTQPTETYKDKEKVEEVRPVYRDK